MNKLRYRYAYYSATSFICLMKVSSAIKRSPEDEV